MDDPRGDEIRVLGPLEIVGGHEPVALRALKERRLLAALLVEAGRVRPVEALVDAVWGDTPPASAGKVLQVYVSKLRKVLPASAHIRTHGPGYAIELAGDVLDAARFERLVDEGREAARSGSPSLAASRLRRALALWRGEAYVEFAQEDFARAEAARLDELRLVAEEERLEAELQLGRERDLLPELRALADANPLRERLQGHAMVALYRSGRQSEALDRYAAFRRRLGEELGLEPGEALRDLQVRILRQDPTLAPAAAETAPAARVPTAPTPLLGREGELRELGELLADDGVRLLVLTGAGGSGKTRLAIEAARRLGASFADGAAFVDLAPLEDPELVLPTIAGALRIEHLGSDPLGTLAAALRPRELLLVLDNFEQLREGAPALVELVSRAPHLTLLVTSRVVLHVSGEHIYPVEPLPADVAVALFRARAVEADARFAPDAEGLAAIGEICERLDGLPLAIELAAGRVRARTPQELLRALERRLPLLTGGPHDLPARQQTLRATLEWSVGLLGPLEQRDLARLSVFAGGCTLEAAEVVCETTLERLSSLVDHSLVRRTVGPLGSRYSLLETIRELASERLEAGGEAEALRRRHAEHSLALAESLGLSVDSLGRGVRQRHDIALAEGGNMRAALAWSLESDPELCLRLALALEQFLAAMSPSEGMYWFGAVLRRAEDLPLELRARALRDLGGATEMSGDFDGAFGLYERTLELFEEVGDESNIIHLRFRLAQLLARPGRLAEARALAEETLDRARKARFRPGEADLLHVLSLIEFHEGRLETAFELERTSLEMYRELGGWPWGEPMKLYRLATYASLLGRSDESEELAREALALSRDVGSRLRTLTALAALALTARRRGNAERAGRLWGAIEAEEARGYDGSWADRRDEYASQVLVPASVELERGLEVGRRMTLDEAAAYALEQAPSSR